MWLIKDQEASLPEHITAEEYRFQRLKSNVHEQLIESLDLSKVRDGHQRELQRHIRVLADRTCKDHPELLNVLDRERLSEEVMSEVFGLGPLDALMNDPDVTDILVNDPYTVYVEKHGQLELTNVAFADERHLMRVIQRIVAPLGRRIDEMCPMVDARLPDGSRVNAIAPPLALEGPALSIRRFGTKPLDMERLLNQGSIVPEIVEFLYSAIDARLGMLVSGGTGAGKTTLLNCLSRFIPSSERLITIEDSAELILQHRHRVRLETRPQNTEGRGEVSQRELVRNSLRMRPDRIIVGEVRGAEVWDMLQAMNTGHEGSLTTIHANGTADALLRLEMMAAMTGFEIPVQVLRQYVVSALRLVVHCTRAKGGRRRLMQVTEIQGVADGAYVTKDIFRFEQTGVDDKGHAVGDFHVTGEVPACLPRLAQYGAELSEDFFQKRTLAVRSQHDD